MIFSIGTGHATAVNNGSVIYVNDSSGSDSNTGYDWSSAKLTINNATNTVNNGGTVNIASGSYTGAGNNNIYINKNMIIQGENPYTTIINAQGTNTIFNINNGYNVNILNLTLTNGNGNWGGAIYNDGVLNISNTIFSDNIQNNGYNGGAVFNDGYLTVTDCSFTGNSATGTGLAGCGGAVFNDGNCNVTDSTFNNNTATNGWGGGALFNAGALTVTSSTFTDDTAAGTGESGCGGGITNWMGNCNVTSCTFTSNNASSDDWGGGGIFINEGMVNITSCLFAGNTAKNYGGTLFNNNGGTCYCSSSYFTNNTANMFGGAIFNEYNLDVSGCTFNENNATNYGGALYNYDGTATLHFNRIIANNHHDIYVNNGNVDALYNWWGTNFNPLFLNGKLILTNPVTAGRIYGGNSGTWMMLNLNATPINTPLNGTSTVTADLLHDNQGVYHDPVNGTVPYGQYVTFINLYGPNYLIWSSYYADFTTTLGILKDSPLNNGVAKSTLNAGSVAGEADISSTVDSQTVYNSVNVYNPPKMISIDPANNSIIKNTSKVITVKFNVPVQTGNGNFEFRTSTGTAVPFTPTINGTKLTLTPSALLVNGVKYYVILHSGSLKDQAGNPLALTSSSFTVDTTPPTVTSIDPVNGSTNVPGNKVIKVTFNEPIKAGTNNITLTNSTGTPVPLTFNIVGNVLTINHTALLTTGKYTLSLHTGCITDLAGNQLALKYISFNTDTTPPTVTSIDPVNGSVSVPGNKVIKVTLSEPIKAGTNNITLTNSSGTPVALTFSIVGNVLTINHTAVLTTGKYTLSLHTGCITDLAGNSLALKYISFNTA